MDVRFLRLVGGAGGGLPDAPPGLLDDLRFLRERRGEKIAAVDGESGKILGAVAVHPDRDDGGTYFRLARIDVVAGHRSEGLEAALLGETERYIRSNRASRLKFGTSPLFTAHAELYVARFGTRYHWRVGARTPDGQPWPHVSCECDFDDPLARPLDLRDEEIAERSVIEWAGGTPSRRRGIVYAGPLSVLLPDLDAEEISRAAAANAAWLPTLYDAFHELSRHGYGFAWFDRLPAPAGSAGGARWYYVMSRVLAL